MTGYGETDLVARFDGQCRLIMPDGTERVLVISQLTERTDAQMIDITTFSDEDRRLMPVAQHRTIELKATVIDTGRTVAVEPLPDVVEQQVWRAISLKGV